MNWKDRVTKRLCGPHLSPGVAHLAVYAAFVDYASRKPAEVIASLYRRFPSRGRDLAVAVKVLLLAQENERPLNTPVQYLGALWEFEGTDAHYQAVMTLPDDIAHGIAEDIPSVTEDDTVRERIRRAALDAWLEAEFGSAALVSE